MSRRDFLKGCAAGTALATLPGWTTTADGLPTQGSALTSGLGDPTSRVMAHFSLLGIDLPRMELVLGAGLSQGGDYCDLFFEHSLLNQVVLEDGAVNRAHSLVTLGLGVRVLRGDQTGYAYTEELTPDAMLGAAKLAAAIADRAPGASAPLKPRGVADHYPVREPWEAAKIERKISILQQICASAASHDPRIRKVSVQFIDENRRLLVATSAGVVRGDIRPMTRCIVTCSAQDGARQEENSFNLAARAGCEFYTPERITRLGQEAARRTVELFKAVVPPAGEMPLVLAAGSSGILLHEAIGHGMEADFNRKRISIYADRIGKSIARPLITIVDDGTNPGARGSLNMDDEGEDSARTVLVEQGILRSYLHDRISAAHYRVPPTGSGRRESFRFMPLPRMRNTYMLPGPHTKEEIIASVKNGIYAVTFTNGQVQIGAGDFTFYIKFGYLIRDGRLTTPIKDVNIIGNGPRVLEEVSMVGQDLELDEGGWTCGKDGQSVPVSLGLPTVRVDRISVGGVNG